MASSRRPPQSLPPELELTDDLWSEDEKPTISRASRIPTTPVSMDAPEDPIPAPPFAIELAEEGEDLQDRVTTIPDIPPEEYARQMMTEDSRPSMHEPASSHGTPLSDPSGLSQSPHNSSFIEGDDDSLEFNLAPNSNEGVAPSELPTAPSPLSFGGEPGPLVRNSAYASDQAYAPQDRGESARPKNPDQILTLPPGVSTSGGFLDPGSQPTARPPPLAPMSEPRMEIQNFSGRFSSAPPQEASDEQAMKDKFAMGDFSGALELAERLLQASPFHTEATSLAAKCREVLEDMYASRIADMQRTPQIAMGPDQIRWLSLDHRAGFLLSMVDGISTMDDLLDVSGMPRLDALRILCALLERKVIKLS